MHDKIRKLLYESFDRELSGKEQSLLNHGLAASPELQREKREIQAIREGVAKTREGSFGPFFVEKTMGRFYALGRPSGRSGLFENLLTAFKPIAIGSAVACLILIFFNWRDVAHITSGKTVAGPISLEEMFERLTWQMMEEAI